ncbi:MAG: PRD domain-containing protein, partial [Erysipelotrichaceae bacterium]|nr:PRD domain-containing protein [Erysipelotrichaceae bacterium]
DFDERPKEEREGIVVNLFQKEAAKFKASIEISSNVLRILAAASFDDNIVGLAKVIRLTCAKASSGMQDGRIRIHTYDLPDRQLEKIEISDRNVEYLDCSQYKVGSEVDQYLELFNIILQTCKMGSKTDISKAFKEIYTTIGEDLIVTNSNSDRALQGMEVTMMNIVNVIAQKHFINIPGNFSFLIAKLLYIYNEYKSRFSHWAEENRELIKAAKETMRREYVSESMIMDEINSLAVTNLETGLPDIVSIIMSLLLSRYNTDLNRNKIFGIIICHGYSTATSIASAVNSLIGSYVFDSIDMPINTTVDEIRDILREKLTRINSYADVVILVDMGSLEEIVQNNEFIGNRNVGIINNVSTKMALSIGYKIKSGCSIEAVFDQADQDYKVEYAIVKARQRDMILFTSESGLQTSQRMVNLFRDSLPREIPVEFLIVPFEKMMEGNIADIVNSGNVLMIIGTEDPGLTVAPFIPLESLVATSNLDLISHKLSGYLDEASVQQLTFNIRRNFTLINIVNYLTILNPKPLLDAITESVEILQQKMNIRLDGKRLVGIYIHVCILVERLVTKTGLIEHDNATAEFVSQHSDFIQKAKESFSQVEQHYNIMIPEAEMKYLYAFLSKENRED